MISSLVSVPSSQDTACSVSDELKTELAAMGCVGLVYGFNSNYDSCAIIAKVVNTCIQPTLRQ